MACWARMNKGFADFMQQADADIFCIQETKMQREQSTFEFPATMNTGTVR